MAHSEQDFLDLSGKNHPISFIPDQKDDLGAGSEKQKEQAIAFCKKVVYKVETYLQHKFSLSETELTDTPKFVFTSLQNHAEINPLTGTIYVSSEYLSNLIPLEPVLIHELLHYYASRWFDFRELDQYLVKGRKTGLSIRYTLEGEAVDGFGIFDEAIVALLTKEIFSFKNTEFPKIEDSYILEQKLLETVITRTLPLKIKLWDTNNELHDKIFTDSNAVIFELQKSAWAKKKPEHAPIHRNVGRILVALFGEKNLHTIATATRRRTQDESPDEYNARIVGILDIKKSD